MRLRFTFETKLLAAFAAAVLVVAVLAATIWKASHEALEAALQVSHSHGVLDNLIRSKADTHLIESSTLRYMIYGSGAQLAERDSAISARETSLRRIKELTADHARQQKRWVQLREAADERLAISGRAVLLRETEGFDAARAY